MKLVPILWKPVEQDDGGTPSGLNRLLSCVACAQLRRSVIHKQPDPMPDLTTSGPNQNPPNSPRSPTPPINPLMPARTASGFLNNGLNRPFRSNLGKGAGPSPKRQSYSCAAAPDTPVGETRSAIRPLMCFHTTDPRRAYRSAP